MDTIINTVETIQIDQQVIRRAGEIIRQGGLVAFPTETVYGLGADALQPQAAKKIYAAKGRPSDNPLIIHVAQWPAVERIARRVPESARLLAEKFWPGPLTMILPKAECVPYETTGGLDTAAVRMPDHPVALALIAAAGGYVAAPSANVSGRPSPTRAEHVKEDLEGRIDMILDGGPVGIGLESTIVDLSGEIPMILRPGAISQEMLAQVIGKVEMDQGLLEEHTDLRPKAPGMKYRHYAPKAKLIVVDGQSEQVIEKINALVAQMEPSKAGIICTEETLNQYPHGVVKSLGTREDEESIARNLYNILREFDQSEVEVIYSEAFQTPKMGQAIMNRLLKAAGHQKMIL
ncbi:MAG: threonylcarbamoyl-AMP synthase [Lachnospiraceae bacterium]|nr:threonylcarbamoyl-AMP synthase [Lachnospiraceae bacterium]